MKLIKTATGSKLVITKNEYLSITKAFFEKEAGKRGMIKIKDFIQWLKSLGYRYVGTTNHGKTYVNDRYPANDPRHMLQINVHTNNSEIDKGQRDEVLKKLGIEFGETLEDLKAKENEKSKQVNKEEEPIRTWEDFYSLPQWKQDQILAKEKRKKEEADKSQSNQSVGTDWSSRAFQRGKRGKK